MIVDPDNVLRDRLGRLREIMNLRFQLIRATHQHHGDMGSNVEQIVREFLREYLPASNRVGFGEVIDQAGGTSAQTDIVITNQYQPFLNDLTMPGMFICEGVACAGEVKSSLTKHRLEQALERARRFKSLAFMVPNDTTVYSNQDDVHRFVYSRPFFLFAFESRLKIATIKQSVDAWNARNNVPLNQQIDAIFLLSRGTVINNGTDEGALTLGPSVQQPNKGYVRHARAQNVLVQFLGWLSVTMVPITFPYNPIVSYLLKTAR